MEDDDDDDDDHSRSYDDDDDDSPFDDISRGKSKKSKPVEEL